MYINQNLIIMSKENFRVTAVEDGKQYWISRSVAVTLVVVGADEYDPVYLVHRRGHGCPDNIGKWSVNCGYINWGETLKEAAVRELYEETGFKVSVDKLQYLGYNDPVGDGKENVTLRFYVIVPKSSLVKALESGQINTDTKSRGGEDGEISEFKLVPIDKSEIDSLGDWAFGHDILLKELANHAILGWLLM